MSKFGGITGEFKHLSIDRFDKRNLFNGTFFLSHNHDDHTEGLCSKAFVSHLLSNELFKVYSSEITRHLVLRKLQPYLAQNSNLRKSFVSLPIDQANVIDIIDCKSGQVKHTVTVTLFPAGHCPGSVMFLFEGDYTVLYTGDFRIRPEQYKTNLFSLNRCRKIQSMYIDTTFCHPDMSHLPSREESAQSVVNIIKQWLDQGPQYIVYICHKTYLGYEQLYADVAKSLHLKVHVSSTKYAEYKHMGNMQSYTTDQPMQSRVHACTSQKVAGCVPEFPCGYICASDKALRVCTIKVSTMHFMYSSLKDTTVKTIKPDFHRVLYSFHASYSEIQSFINYLRPERAVANVYSDFCPREKVQSILNGFVEEAKKQEKGVEAEELGQIKASKVVKRRPVCNRGRDVEDLFSEEDSPVKKKKKTCTSSKIEKKACTLFDSSSDSDGGEDVVRIVT